jgi:hypothetical protein
MKRLSANSIGIQQGSRVLFSDFVNDGPMWAGHGARECSLIITFAEAFRDVPMVHISLGMWDIDHFHNSRVEICADTITPTSFRAVFRTWEDTKVARARVDWLAIGAAHCDDDWQL